MRMRRLHGAHEHHRPGRHHRRQAAEAAIDAAYAAGAEQQARTVALDFTAVEYINSTGIALLVALLARARKDGRPVLAWGLTDHYREIFEITRLADFLEVVPDEQSARAASETT